MTFVTRLMTPTAMRWIEKGLAPSRKAEAARKIDWKMKNFRQARTWRVATIPRAAMMKRPPASAFRLAIRGVMP